MENEGTHFAIDAPVIARCVPGAAIATSGLGPFFGTLLLPLEKLFGFGERQQGVLFGHFHAFVRFLASLAQPFVTIAVGGKC